MILQVKFGENVTVLLVIRLFVRNFPLHHIVVWDSELSPSSVNLDPVHCLYCAWLARCGSGYFVWHSRD